jgi:hypothetical protein
MKIQIKQLALVLAILTFTVQADGSTALFTITPSIPALQEGQPLTLQITPAAQFANFNSELTATIDGVPVTLFSPMPGTWIAQLLPFANLGAHDFSVSLSLEDSTTALQLSDSLQHVNSEIVALTAELATTSDPSVRDSIRNDLFGKQKLLGMLEGEATQSRSQVGSQQYLFTVSGNTSNPSFPSIASVTPAAGPLGGGTALRIRGQNFITGASVKIGGGTASNVNVVSASEITCTSPAFSSLGAQSLEVDLPGIGQPNGELPKGFFVVSGVVVDPARAPVAVTSGSQVILLGQSVSFDGSQSYSYHPFGLSYSWQMLSAPSGTQFPGGGTLPSMAKIGFTPDVYGTFVAELSVMEIGGTSTGRSAPSLAVVQVVGTPVPVAAAISLTTGGIGTTQIAANDPTPGAAESYSIEITPSMGSATVGPTGLVTYSGNAGYAGADAFVVLVTNQYDYAAPITIQTMASRARAVRLGRGDHAQD